MFTLFKTLSYNLTLISSLFADGIHEFFFFLKDFLTKKINLLTVLDYQTIKYHSGVNLKNLTSARDYKLKL